MAEHTPRNKTRDGAEIMDHKRLFLNHSKLALVCITLGTLGLLSYAVSKFLPGKLIIYPTAAGILGFLITLLVLIIRQKGILPALQAALAVILIVLASTYILLFTIVLGFQSVIADRTSSFFQPQGVAPEAIAYESRFNVNPIEITATDGTILRGWLVENSPAERAPLLIYFGGSGSESSELIPYAEKLEGWSVALVNYRGFGLSEGTPTHEKVLSDAVVIYDSLAELKEIDPNRIAVMGYSLGTGVAVYLTDQRPVTATILLAPYDSWTLIGLKQTIIYWPLRRIMKPYFDSLSLAPGIQTPLLCLTGEEDRVVPPDRSIRLAEAWGGEVSMVHYPGEDHYLIIHNDQSWKAILEFLREQ